MPSEPEIKMMSYKARTRFFQVLFLIFIIALPAFIFYTTGYRISFEEEGTTVVTTGGMYITTDNLEVDVYLDDEQIERPRLFRSAYYIQNIESGMHRAVVQGEGIQTWVKDLPVDPYIVTEVAAFNMPVIPNVRPIPQFVNSEGISVFFGVSSTTDLFPNATITAPYIVRTNRATTTLTENSEYTFVADLFVSTTTDATLLERIETQIERFTFSTTTPEAATTTEQYIEKGNMRLVEREDELYAVWIGAEDSVPHYFCVPDTASTTITERYGEHVAEQVEFQRNSTTTPLIHDSNRVCRTQIKLDLKRMELKGYDFLPGSTDIVLLQLEDGLYVEEIDDRSWQNTQIIYPGDNFEAVVTDNNIYIHENDIFFELLTEIETN